MSTVVPPRPESRPDDRGAVPAPRADVTATPTPPPRPTNITLKITMALTGTVFALYVLVHMIGNLKIYTGAGHFDAYAHWLRTLLEPLMPYEGTLWVLRVVLLLCLIAHVGASIMLIVRSHRAKGRFRRKGMSWRRLPATLMPYTGVILLVFIVFHILDLTTGTKPVAADDFKATTEQGSHAYHNLVDSFQRWPVTTFYIVVMVLLATHLVHGLWSVVNDLGATGKRLRQAGAVIAFLVAIAVMVGNISIPVAVLTGLVD